MPQVLHLSPVQKDHLYSTNETSHDYENIVLSQVHITLYCTLKCWHYTIESYTENTFMYVCM